ncbi:tRNA pseudouridine(38-40) synthase TruA [Halalkalibacter sp. APA_J-10(15)]|uniref:tRNA pseudouridine(38-40) synthase TruA n=1 Tax=Halalkalibacter sp. APA_J-10(15) TaxID=2933805 RepID=UPI001FF5D7F5|nr:tRNA pseudouridine(38-40) synthase TruA [Halalkalibacter sp. APA_J-10(15)]MCK0473357.1 tRNA pseudouridine(38-40) synthase TruA [Halalkalibacter sp. APA_J-10(15)]
MQRVACLVSYDGTNFSGYQVQPRKRTVQLELERALTKLHKGQEIKVISSGRTDAGVHAIGQVIHFDTSLHIPLERWPNAFNACLPNDIHIHEVRSVDPQFHARFDTEGKEYRYRLLLKKQGDVFRRHYTHTIERDISMERMKCAAQYLVGKHDFSSFCAANTDVTDKVREVTAIELWKDRDEIIFSFKGNGFLYNMVRIMVGTLLEVGYGKLECDDVAQILAARDRMKASKTAPAQGLYLWKVEYPNPVFHI